MDCDDADQRQEVIDSVRSLLQPKEMSATRDDLLQASRQLRTIAPYNYDAWRLHADLLLNALADCRPGKCKQIRHSLY